MSAENQNHIFQVEATHQITYLASDHTSFQTNQKGGVAFFVSDKAI